ncbi:hypothetical protein SAMN04488092_104225 [Thalassovita taeanensis]|uniref:Uncharacterized protein n=2 Tax=Thalassovita taeanensis TaxID=657014 RepID=A0A1H9DP18_9RHOB|nr:hypothetical protein SAMN04488092_104225 [Thalassovita taeanensis]
MNEMGLADELAETRAGIARLKEREAALRAAILAQRHDVPDGRWSRVEVVERRARVFDKALLPTEIREDPRYWREKLTRYVQCLPVQVQRARPGWPIRRVDGGGAAMH